MDEITRVLKKLKELAPDDLQEAHDEMIHGFDEQGRPMAEGYATFELDGKLHKAPFQKLRDVLQGKELGNQKPAQEVFRGRIPRSVGDASKLASSPVSMSDSEGNHDSGYYWDKNYNYEYMHPDAEKQRVLGKVRK